MACRRVDVFGVARGRPVAAAIVRRTQMRAALDGLAGNLCPWRTGVVAVFFAPAARIFRNAARLRRVGCVLGGPPVGGPLPNIADHVVDAVAVRRECRDRRGAVEAVLAFILIREIALPGIGAMLSARRELVAPGKLGTVEAAARRELPLRFGRQVLARPFGVSERV